MISPLRFVTCLGAAAALAFTMSACSSDPQENEAKACDACAAYVGAVAEARVSLSASSSVGEIRDARDNVAKKYDELEKSLDEVEQDRVDALEDSWNSFTDAVDDVDTYLTVPEAAQSLSGDLDQVEEAQEALGANLNCA